MKTLKSIAPVNQSSESHRAVEVISAPENALELPEHIIAGNLFSYDAASDSFIEKAEPTNRIEMGNIWEDQLWSQFFFDHQTKNIYRGGFPNGERPAHVQLVLLPTIPYCKKLGIPLKTHHEKQLTETLENKEIRQDLKTQRNKNGRRP